MHQHTPDHTEINSNKNPAAMEGETFLPVPDYPDYEVSNFGRVRSFKYKRPRVLKAGTLRSGHLQVGLHSGGKTKNSRVHRLVAEAHIGPAPAGKPNVLHANDVPADNRLQNLRYGDRSDNALDMVLNGNHLYANKTHCPRGHAYNDANTSVCEDGYRHCISCRRARSAAVRAKRSGRTFSFDKYADRKFIELTSAPGADLTPILPASLSL